MIGTRVRFALILCGLFVTSAPLEAQVSEEDLLGFEYAMQFAEMNRYMVHVVGTEDDQDKNRIAIREFEAIYAFDKGETGVKERFETSGRWIASDDSVRDVEERLLIDGKSRWIERQGEIFDAAKLDPVKRPQETYTEVLQFDPFSLPIAYTRAIRSGGADRTCLSLMMPLGRRLETKDLGNGITSVVWFHGAEKDLGLVEIQFDEKFGGMPTSSKIRLRKKGLPNGVVDRNNPFKSTRPYSGTETVWKMHVSGRWLPVSIESEEYGLSGCSYTIKLDWWLDEEVPSQLFTLDDFKLATLKQSLAHQLIEARRAP